MCIKGKVKTIPLVENMFDTIWLLSTPHRCKWSNAGAQWDTSGRWSWVEVFRSLGAWPLNETIGLQSSLLLWSLSNKMNSFFSVTCILTWCSVLGCFAKRQLLKDNEASQSYTRPLIFWTKLFFSPYELIFVMVMKGWQVSAILSVI